MEFDQANLLFPSMIIEMWLGNLDLSNESSLDFALTPLTLSIRLTMLHANLEFARYLAGPLNNLNLSNIFAVRSNTRPSQRLLPTK